MKELSVTMQPQRTYLPAAGKDSLLPLYDVMTRLMGADKARLELLERAKIRPRHRVLEVEGPEHGAHGFLARFLHSSDRLKDNSESRVLGFMKEAGFADPKKVADRTMLFGHIAYYRAIA